MIKKTFLLASIALSSMILISSAVSAAPQATINNLQTTRADDSEKDTTKCEGEKEGDTAECDDDKEKESSKCGDNKCGAGKCG